MTPHSDFNNDAVALSSDGDRIQYGPVQLANPHRLAIGFGVTAVVGPNGSGKTTLANAIVKGRHAFANSITIAPQALPLKLISFSDIHSLGGIDVAYASQRMEATMNDFVPDISDVMGPRYATPEFFQLAEDLNFRGFQGKKINFLSSGELRKLIFIRAMLESPGILVVDNPYIGLDTSSRKDLNSAFRKLASKGTAIVLFLSDPDEVPPFTDKVIVMDSLTIGPSLAYEDWLRARLQNPVENDVMGIELPPIAEQRSPASYGIAFAIRNGHARYGGKSVFGNLDWTVRKGEAWALCGSNGSGKSLLLGMVCADNPQAYANDITLFDLKKGSGESIWDIKRKIGYVSPEMQNFFRSGETMSQVVLQGLRDNFTRFRPVSDKERKILDFWFSELGISRLAEMKYSLLSSGEQRLALLLRALVSQPELLVLDEPFHALDPQMRAKVRRLIDLIVTHNGSSLIFVSHNDRELPDCIRFRKFMNHSVSE